jgi:3-hydroxyisobutyrate dehydrogenase-like beta-hydroxyacid dehydrogenase
VSVVGIVVAIDCCRTGRVRGGEIEDVNDGRAANGAVGWIGAGRMGYRLVERLLAAGCDVSVWNRTREKAEPLAELGATIVRSPADLADRDIVFTMVAGPDDFKAVTTGPDGVLTRPDTAPAVLVDSSTVSPEASAAVRAVANARGTALLAAPVSGNPKVVAAGRLTVVASGPRHAYDLALPYLERFGEGVTYVGEGDAARLVKICHNLFLGVVAQSLAEITVLAEKGGVPRREFFEFLNASVMGSTFTRYKTPAYVNREYTPTFTMELLRKDFDLGLDAGDEMGVPLPTMQVVRGLVQEAIDAGQTGVDFAALIEVEAARAGLEMAADPDPVADGLGTAPASDVVA